MKEFVFMSNNLDDYDPSYIKSLFNYDVIKEDLINYGRLRFIDDVLQEKIDLENTYKKNLSIEECDPLIIKLLKVLTKSNYEFMWKFNKIIDFLTVNLNQSSLLLINLNSKDYHFIEPNTLSIYSKLDDISHYRKKNEFSYKDLILNCINYLNKTNKRADSIKEKKNINQLKSLKVISDKNGDLVFQIPTVHKDRFLIKLLKPLDTSQRAFLDSALESGRKNSRIDVEDFVASVVPFTKVLGLTFKLIFLKDMIYILGAEDHELTLDEEKILNDNVLSAEESLKRAEFYQREDEEEKEESLGIID